METRHCSRHCSAKRQPNLWVILLIVFGILVVITIAAICLQKLNQPTDPTTHPTTNYKNEFPKYVKWDKEDVKKLQTALGIKADGRLGPETGNAIRAYQYQHGLKVDGAAGPETRQSLGITNLKSSNAFRYVADLESIARNSTSDYLVYISDYSKMIAVYHRESEGYWKCLYYAACSTGKDDSPTLLGDDVIQHRVISFQNEKKYWCYAVFYSGEYGIHSTSCTSFDPKSGRFEDIDSQIGKKISPLGCILVEPSLAKFIYENCPNGTHVVRDDRKLKNYDPFSINP
ncbi:murein L,D-transpeptidase [Candidatus Saccharibacteria bacterium]|nr:murein L,D-transpeptidase [Candidatus Saccharibacteria bacterium]